MMTPYALAPYKMPRQRFTEDTQLSKGCHRMVRERGVLMSSQGHHRQLPYFPSILQDLPDAAAKIRGGADYPSISGDVSFYQTPVGVLVSVQIRGLPQAEEACRSSFFAFHIHAGSSCSGNAEDGFANTLTHYNPEHCPHPAHAGDLPPLLGNHGLAFSVFLSDRFSVHEIIGRAVVIHQRPDDFSTQPSGNAGTKIACGEIRRLSRRNRSPLES